MLYAWHPFYGQEVTIHGERNRRGTVVFACSIGEDPKTAPLEVPAWMLDAAVCRIFRPGPSGRVTVEALRLLRRTLDAAVNVIEAQHQLIAFGGSDAPINEDSKDAAQIVATSPQIQQCPREINPQVVALLVRLLRQYVDRKATTAGEPPEGGHE